MRLMKDCFFALCKLQTFTQLFWSISTCWSWLRKSVRSLFYFRNIPKNFDYNTHFCHNIEHTTTGWGGFCIIHGLLFADHPCGYVHARCTRTLPIGRWRYCISNTLPVPAASDIAVQLAGPCRPLCWYCCWPVSLLAHGTQAALCSLSDQGILDKTAVVEQQRFSWWDAIFIETLQLLRRLVKNWDAYYTNWGCAPYMTAYYTRSLWYCLFLCGSSMKTHILSFNAQLWEFSVTNFVISKIHWWIMYLNHIAYKLLLRITSVFIKVYQTHILERLWESKPYFEAATTKWS